MSASEKNSTVNPLKANSQFTGISEDVGAFGSYTIAVRTATNIRLKILQGGVLNRWDDVRILNQTAMTAPPFDTETSPVVFSGLLKMKYFKLEVLNTESADQAFLRCDVVFRDAMPLNILDDSIAVGGIDENGDRRLLATTVDGVLKTNTTVSVENITLSPETDGVRFYGSTNQDIANAKLVNTDADGKLNVITPALSEQTDAVSTAGIDENGVKRLLAVTTDGVLKTNTTVSVEDIRLDGATDAIRIMGSTDQDVANIKLINTDVDGRLNTNILGSSDGNDRIILKTETSGTLNTIAPTTDALITALNALTTENKTLLQKLEINANQLPSTTQMINVGAGNPPLQFAGGDVIGTVLDMGINEERTNDVCFSGHILLGTFGFNDPSIILQYSHNSYDWFSDGTSASFYKPTAINYQFNFQRNNVGLRYVRLLCERPVQIEILVASKFKN